MHQWNNPEDEQARDQKPDPDEHDRFDHEEAPPGPSINPLFTRMPRPPARYQRGRPLT